MKAASVGDESHPRAPGATRPRSAHSACGTPYTRCPSPGIVSSADQARYSDQGPSKEQIVASSARYIGSTGTPGFRTSRARPARRTMRAAKATGPTWNGPAGAWSRKMPPTAYAAHRVISPSGSTVVGCRSRCSRGPTVRPRPRQAARCPTSSRPRAADPLPASTGGLMTARPRRTAAGAWPRPRGRIVVRAGDEPMQGSGGAGDGMVGVTQSDQPTGERSRVDTPGRNGAGLSMCRLCDR